MVSDGIRAYHSMNIMREYLPSNLPNISKVVSVLIIPHSNAAEETVVSLI